MVAVVVGGGGERVVVVMLVMGVGLGLKKAKYEIFTHTFELKAFVMETLLLMDFS